MVIIITNGHPKSGKTTLQELAMKNFKVDKRSSIDLVKELYGTYFDWGGKKNAFVRKQLSDLKSLIEGETNLIEQDLMSYVKNSEADYFFIDIREPELIECYKQLFSKEYKVYTLKVVRDDAEKEVGNESDDNVDNYDYSFIINNNGTLEELEEATVALLKTL